MHSDVQYKCKYVCVLSTPVFLNILFVARLYHILQSFPGKPFCSKTLQLLDYYLINFDHLSLFGHTEKQIVKLRKRIYNFPRKKILFRKSIGEIVITLRHCSLSLVVQLIKL